MYGNNMCIHRVEAEDAVCELAGVPGGGPPYEYNISLEQLGHAGRRNKSQTLRPPRVRFNCSRPTCQPADALSATLFHMQVTR